MTDEKIAKMKRRFDRQVAAARYWLLSQADNDARYFAAVEALEFGMAHHNGKRNGGGPEFMHQIEIFHMLRTLRHYLPNPVMSYILAFLHDAVEDAQKQPDGSKVYVTMATITMNWGTRVAEKLRKLSKEIEGVKNPDYSLDAIFEDEDCALVKLGDRCNNVSTMMGVFKRERALRYIKETVEEFIPRAKAARRRFPEQEGAFENMKLILNGQMSLIELMMPTYQVELTDEAKAARGVEEGVALLSSLSHTKHQGVRPKLGMILSIAGKGLIGNENGKLIVDNAEDMRHFKSITGGSAIIMGRNTFNNLALMNGLYKDHPLPGRHVFVLTHHIVGSSGPGWTLLPMKDSESIDDAVEKVQELIIGTPFEGKTIWVAGGAKNYREAVHSKYLTQVNLTKFQAMTPAIERVFDAHLTSIKNPVTVPWHDSTDLIEDILVRNTNIGYQDTTSLMLPSKTIINTGDERWLPGDGDILRTVHSIEVSHIG